MSEQPRDEGRSIFGIKPIKVLFAAEYVLQGLANPFQGMTYQPFFKHFRFDYKLDEAAVQGLFARSYLAWSFKPLIGFLIDALGKTRGALIALLGASTLFFLLAPVVDTSAAVFFWMMFVLSVVLACTDVVVDRASVVEGDEESKATGRSKAATVGLNQAISWIAIYGSSILAAIVGGWVADNASTNILLPVLGLVPLGVLLVAWRLPKDTAAVIPLTTSVRNFWDGLNTGPILWIVVFYFLFHFQPQAGALWNNYLIEDLHFTQTQIGYSDGGSYVGYLLGTIAFARWGIRWQDAVGLRRLFKIFIPICAAVSLTQYVLVEPYFSQITGGMHGVLSFLSLDVVRLGFLVLYNVALAAVIGFIRMSTFSLVGVVIPAAAAGSLFAGFMSVANVAYSFSYSSGSWLYAHGMSYAPLRQLQLALFGVGGGPGDHLHIAMLVLIGSCAYFMSFVAVHKVPDRRQTVATEDVSATMIGPSHFATLGRDFLLWLNVTTGVLMAGAFAGLIFGLDQDPIASALLSFFGVSFLRKNVLDWRYAASTAT